MSRGEECKHSNQKIIGNVSNHDSNGIKVTIITTETLVTLVTKGNIVLAVTKVIIIACNLQVQCCYFCHISTKLEFHQQT
jgi:hypothetical protein